MSIESGKALSWSFVMNISSLGINAGLMFVLAAILGPENFGIVAISSIFLFFLQILGGQFFIAVLIQRDVLEEEHIDTVFWLSSCWCVLMACLAALLADFWAGVNRTPEVAPVIMALAPLVLIKGLAIAPRGLLLRKLDFKHTTIAVVISSLCGGIGGIYFGLSGYGVWALVIQQWILEIVLLSLVWFFSRFRPHFRFSKRHLIDVLPFARGAFLNELGGFAQSRSEAILLGILFGPVLIALYRISDRMVQIITSILSRSIASFLLPFASRHQNDEVKLKQIIEQCVRLSTALSFPVLGVLAGNAPLVLEILGSEWAVAWIGLMLLCVVGALQSFSLLTPHLLQAIGRPGVGAAVTWGTAATSVCSFVVVAYYVQSESVQFQLAAVSGARALVFLLINVPVNLFVIIWAVGFKASFLGRLLLGPLMSFVVGAGSGYALAHNFVPLEWHWIIRFILSVGGSGVLAIATLLIIDIKVRDVAIRNLKHFKHRFFTRIS
ncbi:oligosaccharide flippase family protein [Sneathiella sp.]|jgi:PST family polysaccharide transporter|uniref:oligosaccharide flippase family protein n=1 Tax=Sneathiella sp. TaxID=1964365 RepID=UPI0039E53995